MSSLGPCVRRNSKGRTQNKHKAKLCLGKFLKKTSVNHMCSEFSDEARVGSSQGMWCLYDRTQSWDLRETCVPLSSLAKLDEVLRVCRRLAWGGDDTGNPSGQLER